MSKKAEKTKSGSLARRRTSEAEKDDPPRIRAQARIKVQLYLGDEIAMGPGKRELLDHVEREGSISAAARSMGLSYRRAWLMIDTMNRCFEQPLVVTDKGGQARGGAELTTYGKHIRDRFASVEQRLERTAARSLAALRRQLRNRV